MVFIHLMFLFTYLSANMVQRYPPLFWIAQNVNIEAVIFFCVNSSTLCSFWHVLFNFSNSEWHLLLPIIELWLEGVNCVEQLEKFFYLILFQVIPKPEQRGKILFGLDHGQLNTGPFGGCIFRHNITKKGHIWDFGCMFSNDESDMGSGYVNR